MADDFDLGSLREAAAQGRIHWHQHTLERLLERGVSRSAIVGAIMDGEVIEVYPSDTPYPSCLIMLAGQEPLHVVAAVDSVDGVCHVITTYRPDLDHFEPDLKTRKKAQDD